MYAIFIHTYTRTFKCKPFKACFGPNGSWWARGPAPRMLFQPLLLPFLLFLLLSPPPVARGLGSWYFRPALSSLHISGAQPGVWVIRMTNGVRVRPTFCTFFAFCKRSCRRKFVLSKLNFNCEFSLNGKFPIPRGHWSWRVRKGLVWTLRLRSTRLS